MNQGWETMFKIPLRLSITPQSQSEISFLTVHLPILIDFILFFKRGEVFETSSFQIYISSQIYLDIILITA